MDKKLWVVSEIFYPEEIGTGYYLTGLSEGLCHSFNVNVLCGYPSYEARGKRLTARETRNGVHIIRCWGTTFNKNVILFRLVNLFTISFSILLKALALIKRDDLVLVVTNPPLLPFVVGIVCRLKRAKCVLRLDDIYPEILIATRMADAKNLAVRFWERMTRQLYLYVDRITVVGRDMANLVQKKLGQQSEKVIVIPNWADVDLVIPIKKKENQLLRSLGLENKFIVQCAGNMGRAQGIENMFEAVKKLKDERDVHFLFIGSGAKKKWMQNEVLREHLDNVTLINQKPRSEQLDFLNASDIIMISLIPGMTGAGVPSRMYNAMAAGKPIIAIAEPHSELALVVREEEIGWIIPPEQPDKLADVISNLRVHGENLRQMGIRARKVAVQKYSPDKIINVYRKLLEDIS